MLSARSPPISWSQHRKQWKAFLETFKFRPLSAKTCSLSKLKRVFPIGLLDLKRIEILKVA
jgi:hypothetical protein